MAKNTHNFTLRKQYNIFKHCFCTLIMKCCCWNTEMFLIFCFVLVSLIQDLTITLNQLSGLRVLRRSLANTATVDLNCQGSTSKSLFFGNYDLSLFLKLKNFILLFSRLRWSRSQYSQKQRILENMEVYPLVLDDGVSWLLEFCTTKYLYFSLFLKHWGKCCLMQAFLVTFVSPTTLSLIKLLLRIMFSNA